MSEERSVDERKDREESDQERSKGVNWTDPTVPVGDAPALPRWPTYFLAVAWTGWIIVLLAMALAGRAAPV